MSRKLIAGMAGLLAACSSGTTPAPTPTTGPTATPSPATTAAAAGAAADDGAVPVAGEQKTFGDWTVACDNTRRCSMASLGADGGAFPNVTMQLTRNAGPDGGYEIALGSPDDSGAAPAALVTDRGRFAVTRDGLAGAPAQAVADAIVSGRKLDVRGANGQSLGSVSLAGAAAALRYIDAAQGRAGTVTATVARGDRPAQTVPPAAAPPRVRAVAFGGATPALSAAQVADMRRTAKCGDIAGDAQPAVHALADGAALVLLPCSTGAYNRIDALFVVRDGTVAPATLDAPAGFDATGADSETPVRSVVNGEVEGGMLTSYAKGRGLGDCGVTQRFVWDGGRLRLVEQRTMGECRGNPDFLTVWRAQVARR